LLGFTQRVKAKVDFGGNAVADVSGEKPADIVWTSDGGLAEGSHAKTRRKGRRRFSVNSLSQVPQFEAQSANFSDRKGPQTLILAGGSLWPMRALRRVVEKRPLFSLQGGRKIPT
jgi:hypothetical protein